MKHSERSNGLKGWLAVLDWMAKIRVAGVESVATGVGLSVRQVHRHAAMLSAEGFLKRPRVADGGGPMLVVTPRGVREAGHEVRSGTAPGSLVALLHGRGVGWIAAHCERSGRPWYGPLELRDTGFQLRLGPRIDRTPRTHLPDLGFILDEERWAVEFERVQKSRERLRWILDAYHTAQLGRELECVLYVCATPRIERVVQGVASEIGLDLVTRPLERIIREARER